MIQILQRLKIAWTSTILVSGCAAVANLIAPEVEQWRISRYIFALSKLWPEAVVLTIVLFAWATFDSWRPRFLSWIGALGFPLHRRSASRGVSWGCVLLTIAVAAAMFVPLQGYARARYAYLYIGTIQDEFRRTQLDRASEFEARFDYPRALAIYKALVQTDIGTPNAAIENRIKLVKGLLDHAAFLHKLETEAENRGDMRDSFRLLVEQVRINPSDTVSARKLETRISGVRKAIAETEAIDKGCRNNVEPPLESSKTALEHAFETATLQRLVSNRSSGPSVCDVFRRFPDSGALKQALENQWQLARAAQIAGLPALVRSGEYQRPKKKRADSRLEE